MDDSEAVVREVERVSLSLWGAIASTRRESGESEEAWRERRRKAYRELAPLLDRVGRLSVDVASLLEFEGNGGEIERVALEHRERVLPQRAFPAAPIAPQRCGVWAWTRWCVGRRVVRGVCCRWTTRRTTRW